MLYVGSLDVNELHFGSIFSEETENLTLDRDKLHYAIYKSLATEKLYSWATTLSAPPSNLRSIGITGLGELALPIETKQLNQIMDGLSRKETPHHMGPVVINSDQLYDPQNLGLIKPISKEMATTAVREAFNIHCDSFSFNVDAKFEKMVICRRNDQFTDTFNYEKEPGTFGCILLQIPVKDVPGGGNVVVYYGEESTFQEFDVYSQSRYYVGVLAGKRKKVDEGRQSYTIMPYNQSPCVMLIANLVWLDVVGSLPKVMSDTFPQFVEAAKLANNALAGWRQLFFNIKKRHLPSTPSLSIEKEGAHWVNTTATNPTGYLPALNKQTFSRHLLDASHTRALCLPVRGCLYFSREISTSRLAGGDALAYRVLKSLNYVSLDLVRVKLDRGGNIRQKKNVYQENGIVQVFTDNTQLVNQVTENGFIQLTATTNDVADTYSPSVIHNGPLRRSTVRLGFLIQPKGAHTFNDKESFILFHVRELLRRLAQHDENKETLHQEYGALLKTLVIDELHYLVQLSTAAVKEVIDCLFAWENDNLTQSFIHQAILIGDCSFVCLQSPRMRKFIAAILNDEQKVSGFKEEDLAQLLKLWLKFQLSITDGSSSISQEMQDESNLQEETCDAMAEMKTLLKNRKRQSEEECEHGAKRRLDDKDATLIEQIIRENERLKEKLQNERKQRKLENFGFLDRLVKLNARCGELQDELNAAAKETAEAKLQAAQTIANTKEEILGQFNTVLLNDLICSICKDVISTAISLGCMHTFCQRCIETWKMTFSERESTGPARTPQCPECRQEIFVQRKHHMVDRVTNNMSLIMRQYLQPASPIASSNTVNTEDSNCEIRT